MILAYITSFIIGYHALILILGETRPKSLSLISSLSFFLGLGISGILAFFYFLIFQSITEQGRFIFIFSQIFCAGALIFKASKYNSINDSLITLIKEKLTNIDKFQITSIVIWLLLFLTLIVHSKLHVFGDWDAWALWNLKTKFFLMSNSPLADITQKLHYHTQPDYPLLLSLINTWAHAFSSNFSTNITLWTAILFTFFSGLLFFSGLKQFINRIPALIASILLLVNPFYTFKSTSQYADIVLACYLLLTILSLLLFFKKRQCTWLTVACISIGLMSFTKNEGIVLSLILIFITTIYYAITSIELKEKINILKHALISLSISLLPAAIFKLFLAPSNQDVGLNITSLSKLTYLNINGLMIIFGDLWANFLDKRWFGILMLIVLLFVLSAKKLFKKENSIITLFFALYSLVLILVYITTTNFGLEWRLLQTLVRITTYLIPSALFYSFYLFYKPEEKS